MRKGKTETDYKLFFFHRLQNNKMTSVNQKVSLCLHGHLCCFITNPSTSIKLERLQIKTYQTLVPTWYVVLLVLLVREKNNVTGKNQRLSLGDLLNRTPLLLKLVLLWNIPNHICDQLILSWMGNVHVEGGGTESRSKRINLVDLAAESGWQLDALKPC